MKHHKYLVFNILVENALIWFVKYLQVLIFRCYIWRRHIGTRQATIPIMHSVWGDILYSRVKKGTDNFVSSLVYSKEKIRAWPVKMMTKGTQKDTFYQTTTQQNITLKLLVCARM